MRSYRFFLVTTVVCLAAVPLGAQTNNLAPEDVACNRLQLERLAERAAIELGAHAADKPVSLVLTFGSVSGGFVGLAHTGQYERLFDIEVSNGVVDFQVQLAETAEHHLWFSTNPDEVRLLRNPVRPQLDSISLTRNRLNSDLVQAGDPDAFAFTLNPTLDDSASGSTLLRIDNLDGSAGTPADAKPGRGLAGIVDSCHDQFKPLDLHVFAVLAKILRLFPVQAISQTRGQLLDSQILIYRGSSGLAMPRYRVDVWLSTREGASVGRLSLEVKLVTDDAGRPFMATLRSLAPCAPGEETDCTSVSDEDAFVLAFPTEPVFSGAFWEVSEQTPVVSNFEAESVSFSWEDLLAGTSWIAP